MANPSRLIVKPEVAFLYDLFQQLERGILRVPDFQRTFVWNEKQMLELLDTVLNGYPIGSILIWDPRRDIEIQSSKEIGPFQVPESEGFKSFVIDGYQRLTTLYSVLKNSEFKSPSLDKGNVKYTIYLDIEELDQQKLALVHFSSTRPIPDNLVPLHLLWEADDMLEVSNRFHGKRTSGSGAIVKQLQGIYNDLRAFRVSVIRMEGGELEDAIEIFTRLNSTGRKVTSVQMLNALTETKLNSTFDRMREELRTWSFDSIEEQHLMRALYISTEKDIFSLSPRTFKDLTKKTYEALAEETTRGLMLAAEFLWEECNVPGSSWLPYSLQFLLIGEFFRKCPEPSIQKVENLKKWFWATAYQGWFAGATFSKVRTSIGHMRGLAESNEANFIFKDLDFKAPVEPFPTIFKNNSARVSTFFLFYLSLRPHLFASGAGSDARMLMADRGRHALNVIVSSEKHDHISNLLIGHSASPAMIQSYIQNSNSVSELATHGLDERMVEMLSDYKYADFHQARKKRLIELEREFIRSFGLTPSKQYESSDTREDSDIQ